MKYNEHDNRAFCTQAPFYYPGYFNTQLTPIDKDILRSIVINGSDKLNGVNVKSRDMSLPVSVQLAITNQFDLYKNVYVQLGDDMRAYNELVGGYYIQEEDRDFDAPFKPEYDACCCVARNLITKMSPNREYDFINWLNAVETSDMNALKSVLMTLFSIDNVNNIKIGDLSKGQWYIYCGNNGCYIIIPVVVNGAIFARDIMDLSSSEWKLNSMYHKGRPNTIYEDYSEDFVNIMDILLIDRQDIFNL